MLTALLAERFSTPGLPVDFVFYDVRTSVNNEAIQITELDASALAKVAATPQLSGSMRPLPTLSFALDYWRAGGPEPAIFKTTNIVIHALTACALAWFFRSLLLISGVPGERARWCAPVLALAWAAHPLQVSSVLYADRKSTRLNSS